MATPTLDSFLPSGGFDFSHHAFSPPPQAHRSVAPLPESLTTTRNARDTRDTSRQLLQTSSFPLPRSNSHTRHHQSYMHPLSPPKTRSTSADHHHVNAQLVDDWKEYTRKLRERFDGQRAHMAVDIARMEELHEEERQLWAKERSIMTAHIAELEEQLKVGRTNGTCRLPLERFESSLASYIPSDVMSDGTVTSNAMSMEILSPRRSSRFDVPQTNGRNPDGTPYYAPASANPRRTFDSSESSDLRVGDMPVPGADPITVTSKSLTPADFIRSPSSEDSLPVIPETMPYVETIDIGLIAPGLEGISIKPSAVAPSFAAKVLSPQWSPNKLSPPTSAPQRPGPRTSSISLSSPKDENSLTTLQVINHPVEHRRIMHAGHTPNHSISILNVPNDPGDSTPRQISLIDSACLIDSVASQTDDSADYRKPLEEPAAAASPGLNSPNPEISSGDGDMPLVGRLGLTNDIDKDKQMLKQVNAKLLQEMRKSQPTSPQDERNGIGSAALSPRDQVKQDMDDHKPLKLKPSMNFGRPMGQF